MPIHPIHQSNAAAVGLKNETAKSDVKSASQPVNQDTIPTKAPSVATDTVKISHAAVLAAEETTETSSQTAKEAQSGDIQAKNLIARQAASEAAKGSATIEPQ